MPKAIDVVTWCIVPARRNNPKESTEILNILPNILMYKTSENPIEPERLHDSNVLVYIDDFSLAHWYLNRNRTTHRHLIVIIIGRFSS
jgi:hypothetical protein